MKNNKYTILLDMDGVIANFVKGAAEVFNTTYEELLDELKPEEWTIEFALERMGKIKAENITLAFWERIEQEGEKFWSELPMFPEAKELYEFLFTLTDNVFFCTSPSYKSTCVAGKLKWLQKHFGGNTCRNYVFTPAENKMLLANKYTILIDDSDKNIKAFKQAGGVGILYPRKWNSLFYQGPTSRDSFTYIKNRLTKLFIVNDL